MSTYLDFLERYSGAPFSSDEDKAAQLSRVAKAFEAYETGNLHQIDLQLHQSTQHDLALCFYQVTDFLHKEGVSNTARFIKLAKVCLDAQTQVKPMQWDLLMGNLYNCFSSRTRRGYRYNSADVQGEFSAVLLDEALGHANPSITKVLCGQGRSEEWWESRKWFTPSILMALLAREDRRSIIDQQQLERVLDQSAPLYGIHGLAPYLSQRGKGRLLDDAMGL